MTALDDELIPEVRAIIAEVGVASHFRTDAATFDVATQKFGDEGESTQNVTSSPLLEYDWRHENAGDSYVFLENRTDGWEPEPGMFFRTGTKAVPTSPRFVVVSVKRHFSGESVAAFEVQLRV